MNEQQMIDLLRADVVPALGCTEPVCVSLCAAGAGSVLAQEIRSIDVQVNGGIYKNGMSAGIPNCGEVGLDYAAAIGACLKNPEKKLEILEDVTPEILNRVSELVKAGAVRVTIDPREQGLYVKCVIHSEGEESTCIIRDAHTNVVWLEKDGEVLFKKENCGGKDGDNGLVCRLKEMKIAEIRSLVDTVPEADLEFLLDGVEMNEALAAYSMENETGVGIAAAFRREIGSPLLAGDLLGRIILKVSSAAESRLDGCPLPTMSSSGAGTKGLAVILPVSEAAKVIGASKEKEVRALAFAHLVNRYINAYIGKLSPMCTCVMAASTAAAVGITYLLGGTDEQIGYAVRSMSGTVTGMICDGGKTGCAMKVSAGSAAAVFSAITAIHDAALRASDGICAETPEDCIRNMARIGSRGMSLADEEILNIMMEKQKM